jgi:pantoate--beta-alanine ligase
MQVWNTVAQWQARRAAIGGRALGFVPTMGALHRGHAALVERCRRENEIAVASILVNPAQFNDPHDLQRYPRTLESDLALLGSLRVDDVFAPAAAELYPHGYRFRVTAADTAAVMEGVHRPGFFEGVMTVVLKLLNLVRPRRAYFGEKDYQQYRTLAEMAAEFFLLTEIVACPTVRGASGLAESSRNALLSPAGRDRAACIFRSLSSAATAAQARAALQAAGFAVEYVEERWGRRFAAASLEGVRLIDNVPLPPTSPEDRA